MIFAFLGFLFIRCHTQEERGNAWGRTDVHRLRRQGVVCAAGWRGVVAELQRADSLAPAIAVAADRWVSGTRAQTRREKYLAAGSRQWTRGRQGRRPAARSGRIATRREPAK